MNKEIKTINQASIVNDKDWILDYLNNSEISKINKKYFKGALKNSIKYNREDIFYLLFEFNEKHKIINNSDIFFDLLTISCDNDYTKYLVFLKNKLPFKCLLIENKNKYFHCIQNLLTNTIKNNSLKALKFLLTDNNQIIKDVLNYKTSNLTYNNYFKSLFQLSCSISKIAIVKYLFEFDIIKKCKDSDFFFDSLFKSITNNKLNTSKFLYKKINLYEKDIITLMQLSIKKRSYNFFKFLLKNNQEIELNNKETTKSVCHLITQISIYYKKNFEKDCQFIQYLVESNIHFDFSEVIKYSKNKYTYEKLNLILIQQKIKEF